MTFHGAGEKEPKLAMLNVSKEFAGHHNLPGLPAIRLYLNGTAVDYLW
jgi:hypothetical protein